MSTTDNMYGYNDYNGPLHPTESKEDSDEELDPLRVGQWMEGDSLAPPLGSNLSTIHEILQLGNISSNDTLYDLGCGDGRVCLEAYVKYECKHCIGIEIEDDLVDRFNALKQSIKIDPNREIKVIHSDICNILDKLVNSNELPIPTIIYIYLLPAAIERIQPNLEILLRKNVRIVCNTWGLKGLKGRELDVWSGNISTSVYVYES